MEQNDCEYVVITDKDDSFIDEGTDCVYKYKKGINNKRTIVVKKSKNYLGFFNNAMYQWNVKISDEELNKNNDSFVTRSNVLFINREPIVLKHESEMAAFLANPFSIKFMERLTLTYESYLDAVKRESYAIEFVPKDLIDMNMCKIAVSKNFKGSSLKFVPEKFKTDELCWIALKSCPASIRFVPNQTREMCEYVVKEWHHTLSDEYIKKENIDHSLEKIAVNSCGYAFKYVENQDEEMILESIEKSNVCVRFFGNYFNIMTEKIANECNKHIDSAKNYGRCQICAKKNYCSLS